MTDIYIRISAETEVRTSANRCLYCTLVKKTHQYRITYNQLQDISMINNVMDNNAGTYPSSNIRRS
jgi:hypothetical protein